MSKYYVLNADGEIVAASLLEWGRYFEAADRHVANDMIGDVRVSTVFLGIDHSLYGERPVLFETLVFGGPLDGEMDRYHTKEQASIGHKEMVDRVRGGMQ
jgi:hypothetical protein